MRGEQEEDTRGVRYLAVTPEESAGLQLAVGLAIAAAPDRELKLSLVRLANRVNAGNPHWEPFPDVPQYLKSAYA